MKGKRLLATATFVVSAFVLSAQFANVRAEERGANAVPLTLNAALDNSYSRGNEPINVDIVLQRPIGRSHPKLDLNALLDGGSY